MRYNRRRCRLKGKRKRNVQQKKKKESTLAALESYFFLVDSTLSISFLFVSFLRLNFPFRFRLFMFIRRQNPIRPICVSRKKQNKRESFDFFLFLEVVPAPAPPSILTTDIKKQRERKRNTFSASLTTNGPES